MSVRPWSVSCPDTLFFLVNLFLSRPFRSVELRFVGCRHWLAVDAETNDMSKNPRNGVGPLKIRVEPSISQSDPTYVKPDGTIRHFNAADQWFVNGADGTRGPLATCSIR